MNRKKSLRKTRDFQLAALAGFVSALVLFSQFNLQEVLRLDRLQHCLISGALFGVFFTLWGPKKYRFFTAITFALAIGFAKELMDHQAQGFDIVANFFGISLALLMLFSIKFLYSEPLVFNPRKGK